MSTNQTGAFKVDLWDFGLFSQLKYDWTNNHPSRRKRRELRSAFGCERKKEAINRKCSTCSERIWLAAVECDWQEANPITFQVFLRGFKKYSSGKSGQIVNHFLPQFCQYLICHNISVKPNGAAIFWVCQTPTALRIFSSEHLFWCEFVCLEISVWVISPMDQTRRCMCGRPDDSDGIFLVWV